jgi:hypothetical protein
MAAEEKLAYIQVGDEVGHYGAIKQLDGSRDTFYSTVIGTHEGADGATRLLIASRKFPDIAISINLELVFERTRVISGEGTSTHYFEEPGSEG